MTFFPNPLSATVTTNYEASTPLPDKTDPEAVIAALKDPDVLFGSNQLIVSVDKLDRWGIQGGAESSELKQGPGQGCSTPEPESNKAGNLDGSDGKHENDSAISYFRISKRISYLPLGLWNGVTTFEVRLRETKAGIETVTRASMGLRLTAEWIVRRNEEGKSCLMEKCEIDCHPLLMGTVRRNLESDHANFRNVLGGKGRHD